LDEIHPGGEPRSSSFIKAIKESVRALFASPIVDKLPPSIWQTGFVLVNKLCCHSSSIDKEKLRGRDGEYLKKTAF
jgi:hypothetical protein